MGVKALDSILVSYHILESISVNAVSLDSLNPRGWMPSHTKFREDTYNLKKQIINNFADLLYDYLLEQIKMELGHSMGFCKVTLNYNNKEIVQGDFANIDPQNLLDMGELMFSKGWSPSYGGPAWSKVVDVAKRAKNLQPTIFIDVVTDMQHNEGWLLNKWSPEVGTVFMWTSSALHMDKFLNAKTYSTSVELLGYSKFGCTEVQKLAHRFAMLYLSNSERKNLCLNAENIGATVKRIGTKNTVVLLPDLDRENRKEVQKYIDRSWEEVKTYQKFKFNKSKKFNLNGIEENLDFETEE